jgi:cysteine desulfurase family protein
MLCASDGEKHEPVWFYKISSSEDGIMHLTDILVQEKLHFVRLRKMIYFDNAATTLRKPQAVINAVCQAMRSLGNCGRGAHEDALAASRIVYSARSAVSELFQCGNPRNVVFTANSTEALNTAILGMFEKGDHIISTDMEHNSVLRPLYYLQRMGVDVDFIPADMLGNIQYDDIPAYIRPETRAIICTHASNLTGNLVDVGHIGGLARAHGLLFIVDASQTAGIIPINMKRMNIDVLCFTGHKSLMGPQGTGGMCLAEGVKIRPLKRGGTGVQTYLKEQPEQMPTHLEAGTLNSHGIAGLEAAIRYIQQTSLEKIYAHEHMLMNRFYEGMRQIPEIRIYGDFRAERAPIVAINIGDIPSGEVSDILNERYDIATRPGAHCAPRMHQALGTVEQGAVRFSFGYDNTAEEVDAAVKAVKAITVEYLRK